MDYKSLEELIIGGSSQPTLGGVLSLLETKLMSTLEIMNLNDIQCLPNINRLQSLSLYSCPTLSAFPEDGLPTTLTYLVIEYCSRLELPHEMLAKLTSLGRLWITDSCDSMRSFPLGIFPELTSLYLQDCNNLESLSLIEGGGVDENLSHLNIESCPNLVRFPQGGLPTPNLTHLDVKGCDKLKSLPERIHTLTALRSLKIRDLPNLESIAEDGGLPHTLREFRIENCESLRASSMQGLVSLEKFKIGGRGSDEILETLLKQQLLPTTLQCLQISQLSSLKSLDAKGLKHLTSLSFLRISYCSALEKRTAYLLMESFSFAMFLRMPFPDEGFAIVYSLTIVTTKRNREAPLKYLNLMHICIQASNVQHF